jgi:hypothetical protein
MMVVMMVSMTTWTTFQWKAWNPWVRIPSTDLLYFYYKILLNMNYLSRKTVQINIQYCIDFSHE